MEADDVSGRAGWALQSMELCMHAVTRNAARIRLGAMRRSRRAQPAVARTHCRSAFIIVVAFLQ